MDRDLFIQKYIERLKLKTDMKTDIDTLRYIHRHHLLNIPFENLDIIDNKRIEFDIERIWVKIIEHSRGGICYELNGLLLQLLTYLGFEAKYISATVLEDGNEFDHVLIYVSINTDSWLVDVGFGDNFFEPIKLEENIVHKDLKGNFQIIRVENYKYQLLKSLDGLNYSLEYTFTLQERKLDDFRDRCLYFETSANSRFKSNRICSLEKENGRVSLKDDKLIISEDGNKVEKEIRNTDEFSSYLKQIFNVVLDKTKG